MESRPLRQSLVACALRCLALMFIACAVHAQPYPSKPVRIVTTEPGSGNDLVARLIAAGLSGNLGQQVIVDNRGILAGEIVAKAPPDGYTLLAYGSPFWLAPFIRNNVGYDPVRDFAAVTLSASSPNILVVHPSLPVNSVRELIALAKARPGELNYGSSSTGATPHLAAELFKSMAGVNIMRVPYKGSGAALNDLIGGQVQLMFPNAGAATPHVKSGRLRALAVTTAQPSVLAPGLPTMAASGLPGYESVSPFGIFAPAGTPAVIINRLNQEIVRVLITAEVKERLYNVGVEVVGGSPEQLMVTMKSEMAMWGKVIRDAIAREQKQISNGGLLK
jgi:tripartite-type tricarboxylate transporter receptor subunit TctC